MRLCEVRGCTGTAVALVNVKAPTWNVAESRRVCARHRADLTPTENNVETVPPAPTGPTVEHKYLETIALLRATLMDLDEWNTEDMVDHMGATELVAAIRYHHNATVARWKAKADRLEEEVTAAQAEARPAAASQMMLGAAATMTRRAADELEPWTTERDAVMGMMLRTVVDTLEAVNG
jgi:hypothetical protein